MCTTNSICLVYAKFNGLSCMVPGYRFWGALSLYSLQCFVHISDRKKNPAILKWSSTILTVTHMDVYIIDMLICAYWTILVQYNGVSVTVIPSILGILWTSGSARHPKKPQPRHRIFCEVDATTQFRTMPSHWQWGFNIYIIYIYLYYIYI